MKKLLSLVLAVMMVASLAVSTSAVFILGSDGSYIKSTSGSSSTTEEFEDLIEYYQHLYSSDDNIYYGYIGAGLASGWFEECDECGGFVYCYVADGNLWWRCLNKSCDNIHIPGIDDDCDLDGVKCPVCGKNFTYYIKTINKNGTLYDRYYCVKCQDYFLVKTSGINLDDYKNPIECPAKNCDKKASFYNFLIIGDDLYAYYICDCGKITSLLVTKNYDYDFEDDEFVIKTAKSGRGTIRVNGSIYAQYGEEKVIDIEPERGYVLVDVYVNGKSMGAQEELKIKITGNTFIYAYFAKASTLKTYTLKSEVIGNGKITARKNGTTVSSGKIDATVADTVTYTFTPASKNYYIESVKVNGKSVGAVSSYTVKKADCDYDIKVTFAWKCPYVDVSNKYLKAVEYVTEAGIMSKYRQDLGKNYFSGTTAIYVHTFVAALAEMADTTNSLNSVDDRLNWALANGVITSSTNLYNLIDVQTAADIVDAYLNALEDINDISFKDYSSRASAKANAISINLATETTYNNNRTLHRYDLASVCYLIANLEIDD